MKTIRFLVLFLVSLAGAQLSAQEIQGTITDDEGLPLVGASILEKGTGNGTVTDLDGKYSLTLENDQSTVIISYTGYQTQEIAVLGQSEINASLAAGATLDEVVVTALGIGREERALGYSVQKVDGSDITASATNNALNSLTGKVAGVQISEPNGVAGGTVRVTIRGNNSLVQGKNQPLIIVDGGTD